MKILLAILIPLDEGHLTMHIESRQETDLMFYKFVKPYQFDYDWNREAPYELKDFFNIIDEFVENHFYGVTHPLAQRLTSGKLNREELSFLAIQEYHYYEGTTWWNAFKIGNSDTLEQQRLLHDPLVDELGMDLIENDGDPAHVDLFLRYCNGIGITYEDIQKTPVVCGVLLAIMELMRIAKYRPSFEFIACSNLVAEKMRPIFYKILLNAFDKYYQWVPKSCLRFYEVHAHLDLEHTSIGRKIVAQHAFNHKRDQDAIFSAIVRSMALRQVMYDSIEKAINEGNQVAVVAWPNFPREPWPRPTSFSKIEGLNHLSQGVKL